MPVRIEAHNNDVLLWVKAVPNASRDQIAGPLGDRLKIKVAAAAEAGKANHAVCRAVARALNIKPERVSIESGHTNPKKVVRINAINADFVRTTLAEYI